MAQNETCAVVVTHDRIPMLKKCLEHLCAQTVPCDVWVVDNALRRFA